MTPIVFRNIITIFIILSINFKNPINSGAIAHNVPAVYDVLATRIGKRKGINPFLPAFAFAYTGCQNVGVVSRGSEAGGRPT
jgi:hypothetical protein